MYKLLPIHSLMSIANNLFNASPGKDSEWMDRWIQSNLYFSSLSKSTSLVIILFGFSSNL